MLFSLLLTSLCIGFLQAKPPLEPKPGKNKTDSDQSKSSTTKAKSQQSKIYKVVPIPAGRFIMGCTKEQESDCYGDEYPAHRVLIRHSYLMMQSEVTQGLYKQVMGYNPSQFQDCGASCPVEQISWFDAIQFANQLSREEGREECYQISKTKVSWRRGLLCKGWRLPTEAEWEKAARGKKSQFKYAGDNDAVLVAWYLAISRKKTHSVCEKKKNSYDLCDMSGNVWEWVWDWYGIYTANAKINPRGPRKGVFRVRRGGGWSSLRAWNVRVANRDRDDPSFRFAYFGLRLARTAP